MSEPRSSEPRLTLLRAADRKPSPWKNGGGATTEIAVSPMGASLESFDWRVSMARVESDGPFSVFPGIDRYCAVLAGALSLRVGDAKPVDLDATSQPFEFPGDVPTHAQMQQGPVEDLNVFARRGRVMASIECVSWSGSITRRVHSDTCLVLLRSFGAAIACGTSKLEGLIFDDVVRLDKAADTVINLSAGEAAVAYVVRLTMCHPPPP